ncbi:MAG: type III-A CRISPR-associated RAMP protein Csm3 [Candidatus Brocadia sp. UTAMX1]|jgi:CRISPR-associated protein Csm3|nr:MAG: type III-A CRISPR-associated RAMP protein Csm3 [Candidatus Brocadia sp. UTAMX1]
MKLSAIKKLEGKITLKSGLHIGSGNTEMHIGGTDSPVIKHPHTLEPYIPGSSLKGKVRSLLEMESGLMIYTGGNVVSGETLTKINNNQDMKTKCEAILKIFGSSGANKEDETGFGPTRVSFADCFLDDAWRQMARNNRWLFTEEKSENVINRIKGTAEHPRFIERIPEGTQFNFLVTFKILEKNDEDLFNNVLLKGLKLLEMDALGGSGSRGYGRIKFEQLKLNGEDKMNNFNSMDPFASEAAST